MMKIITFLVVALVLFGSSAAASWFLQQRNHKHEDADKHEHEANEKVAKHTLPVNLPAGDDKKNPRSLLRPTQTPEAEYLSKMASSLQKQTEMVSQREQQIAARHKNLEVVFEDIRKEQKNQEELRKQIAEEMKLLGDRLEAVEKKAADSKKQGQKVADLTRELKDTQLSVDQVEEKRLKQMATVFDSMEAEAAAAKFQEMIETGKLDMAVKILANMRERQAARVLASIQDHAVAVQLLDRLKGLKATPTKQTAGG